MEAWQRLSAELEDLIPVPDDWEEAPNGDHSELLDSADPAGLVVEGAISPRALKAEPSLVWHPKHGWSLLWSEGNRRSRLFSSLYLEVIPWGEKGLPFCRMAVAAASVPGETGAALRDLKGLLLAARNALPAVS